MIVLVLKLRWAQLAKGEQYLMRMFALLLFESARVQIGLRNHPRLLRYLLLTLRDVLRLHLLRIHQDSFVPSVVHLKYQIESLCQSFYHYFEPKLHQLLLDDQLFIYHQVWKCYWCRLNQR